MTNPLERLDRRATSIDGTLLCATPLATDERGALGVFFRFDWQIPAPLQWNVSKSNPGTVRGFHVHIKHTDWLIAVTGTLHVGLRDLRPTSPTYGVSQLIALTPFADMVIIPPGVGHAFMSKSATVHLYGIDEYWDPADEFGCRWNDPALQLDWSLPDPLLSQRDATAGTLTDLERSLRPHWG